MIRTVLLVCAALLCASQTSQATNVQFAARQDIATGSKHLTGLAIADFNGDGKPDIAITDDYSQVLSVYLNDGTGSFNKPLTTTFTVPGIGGLGALVAGDLNEDGKQDLIVAPIAGNQVDIVLLGNGDGTFTQGASVPGSYGFLRAALVDVNGDKHLDLVSGQNGGTYVGLGDGKGNFTNDSVFATVPGLFLSLVVGDFTGDNQLDFIVADEQGNDLQLFPNRGNGTFQAANDIVFPYFGSPSSMATADFNKDGRLDLLVGSANTAALLNGDGKGGFSSPRILPLAYVPDLVSTAITQPVVATADMDANGTPDVVAADDNTNMLSVLLNDGTGTFAQQQPDFVAPLDSGSSNVQLADLNGDGLPDVIVTNYKTQNVSFFLSIIPKQVPAITIQSSNSQAVVGSSVLLTVQVNGSGAHIPSGTVTVTSGSTSFGQQTLNASGQATFTLQNLAAGQYPLSASYSGDTYFAASTSTGSTQAITDFQVALSTPTQTVAPGANATYPVSVSALGGFTGTVALSCSGLPVGYSCPAISATLNGQAATVNLIVQAPMSAQVDAPNLPGRAGRVLSICASVLLCFRFRRRKQFVSTMLLAALGFAVLVGVAGCSGAQSKPAPYTGTSSFTITATTKAGSQTVSHQTTATLVVR